MSTTRPDPRDHIPLHNMTPDLGAMASAISAKPVTVHAGEIDTAYYDMENRRIVINANAPFSAARGFLVHELLHERFTVPADYRAVGDLSPYNNIVEDIRVNIGCVKQLFKLAEKWIYDCWSWLEATVGCDPVAPSMTVLYRAHGLACPQKPWDADARAFLHKHLPTITRAANIRELRPVLEELRDLDRKYQKDAENEQEQKPQKPEGARRGNPSAKRPAKRPGVIASPFHEAHDPVLVTDRKPIVGESNGLSSKTGSFSASDPTYYIDSEVKPEILANLRAWRNRVAEALTAEDKGGATRNLPRGRLDGTRLAHVAANTSDRVFCKPTESRRAVNTAVDVLLDISGSTGGGIDMHLAASAYAVAEACSRVPGVQLGLMRFGSDAQRLMPITHNRTARLEHARACSNGGGTETECAVMRSAAELRATTASRRICIVCTDGASTQPDIRHMVVQLGVELYELHIVSHETADDMDNNRLYCTGTTIHNGLDRLVRTLKIKGC